MTVSVCRQSAIKSWACLVAGVWGLTACVGESSGDLRPPSEPPDQRIAADPGDAWSPPAAADQTTAMADAVESVSARDAEKSYLIPAVEIVAFEFLANQFQRRWVDEDTYGSDSSSIHDNVHSGWVIDKDPFSTNQFNHPYFGSIYHNAARSAGLDYWESLGYDFLGSALWEVAGETDPPSLNDQITTTFAGSFLGEALFRTANWVLRGGGSDPGIGRSALAAVIAPSAAVNRLAFGHRFDASYPSDDPAVFYWLGLGARRNATLKDVGVLADVEKDYGVAAFSFDYGLPGKSGYAYAKPFDYYHFEAAATTGSNAFPESVVVRGLVYGSEYSSGTDYRGIWGLYGSYDYFSPEIFKVSSTGLSLGTTAQYLMSDKLALLGTCMGGIGYTAAGTSADDRTDRAYRYGPSPQAVVALRLVYGDVAMLELTANDYLITGSAGSTSTSGNENILRSQLSLTVRVFGQHALGIQFVQSRRDTNFSDIANPTQSVGALSLFYTFLGDEEFGVQRR